MGVSFLSLVEFYELVSVPRILSILMSLRVAVVGAGAAGLAACRRLAAAGHAVTCFEKSRTVGGCWVPSETNKQQLYASLVTNLPKEIMKFWDIPWGDSRPGRSFVGRTEVGDYLQTVMDKLATEEHVDILFGHEVTSIRHNLENDRPWQLTTVSTTTSANDGACGDVGGGSIGGGGGARSGDGGGGGGGGSTSAFDAVVVANGHYEEPNVTSFRGQDTFPGEVQHSVHYTTPDSYTGTTV